MRRTFVFPIMLLGSLFISGVSSPAQAQWGAQVGIHLGFLNPMSELDKHVKYGLSSGIDAMVIPYSKSNVDIGIGVSIQGQFYVEESTTLNYSITPITTNVNFYLGESSTRGVFSFGLGMYSMNTDVIGPGSVDKTNTGINFGAGVNIFAKESASVDIIARFHHIYADRDNIKFFSLGVTTLFTVISR